MTFKTFFLIYVTFIVHCLASNGTFVEFVISKGNQLDEHITVSSSDLSNIIGCAWKCYIDEECNNFHYDSDEHVCSIEQNVDETPPPGVRWNRDGEQQTSIPKDCLDVAASNRSAPDGVYPIRTRAGSDIDVYCMMSQGEGGWTVLMRRFNGEEPFDRTFTEYQAGFGRKNGEHWLGLQNVHEMTMDTTTNIYILSVGGFLVEMDGYEEWSDFSVGPGPGFTLHIGTLVSWSYSDAATGQSYNHLLNNTSGFDFSTKDVDNDVHEKTSCSMEFGSGGWWFKACSELNPTGQYIQPSELNINAMHNTVLLSQLSLKKMTIMFKRLN